MIRRLMYPEFPAPVLPHPTVDSPADDSAAGGEYLPITDPDGVVTARARRSWIHREEKILHPVIHLHVIDREGRIWLQKRSATKDKYPGRWDFAVGGHVAYGEQPEEALFRESSEEIGLRDFNPMLLECYVFEGRTERELVYSFATVGNFRLTADEIEVSEVAPWTPEAITEALGKGIFTPSFEDEFPRIVPALLRLL